MNKHFNLGRETAHIILFLISLAFSVQLAWGLGNNILMSGVFAALFTALEFEKWYASKKVKTDWNNKKIGSFAAYVVVLAVLVSLSIIASYAATRTSIMSQTSAVTVNVDVADMEGRTVESVSFEREQIDIAIADINASNEGIKAEKAKMANEEGIYITATAKFEDMLAVNKIEKEKLLEQRRELTAMIEALEKVEDVGNVMASEKIFATMAEDFGTTDLFMLKVIMLTLIFILEISLFLVTEPLHEEMVVQKDEKEVFTEFVQAMFNNGGKKYLNSDNKVSSATGISVGQCRKYRDMLANVNLRRGKKLIDKEPNGWVSQFPSSTVIDVGLKNLFVEE